MKPDVITKVRFKTTDEDGREISLAGNIYARRWGKRQYLSRDISSVESGEYTLVHIVPSYGCGLVALCQSVN